MGSRAATALVKGALRKMMFAKLKMIAAAGLIGSAVTFVATGLAATSPDREEKPHEESRRIFDSPNLPSAHGGTAELARPGTAERASQRRKPDRPLPTRLLAPRQERPASAVSKVGKHVDLTGDLLPRGRLNRGDSVFSTLGGFKLHMRQDGNLVLYVIDDLPIPGNLQNVLSHVPEAASFYNIILWSSGTDSPGDMPGPGRFASCTKTAISSSTTRTHVLVSRRAPEVIPAPFSDVKTMGTWSSTHPDSSRCGIRAPMRVPAVKSPSQ